MKKNFTEKLRKQLEESLDSNFNQFTLSFKPNVLTRNLDASVKVVELILNGQIKRCEYNKQVIDISGSNATNNQGEMIWKLREVIDPCDDGLGLFCDPYSFVATPISNKPVFITVQRLGLSALGASCSKDVVFKIFSWDSKGNPAPGIGFYWRCRVVQESLVL